MVVSFRCRHSGKQKYSLKHVIKWQVTVASVMDFSIIGCCVYMTCEYLSCIPVCIVSIWSKKNLQNMPEHFTDILRNPNCLLTCAKDDNCTFSHVLAISFIIIVKPDKNLLVCRNVRDTCIPFPTFLQRLPLFGIWSQTKCSTRKIDARIEIKTLSGKIKAVSLWF